MGAVAEERERSSARPVPAVCQSVSVTAKLASVLGRIAKLSVEHHVTVGDAVGHLTRTRTSRQESATAAKFTVERPAVIVGLGDTVCTSVDEVGQFCASSDTPRVLLPSSSTITASVKPACCTPPEIATTSRLNALPATLVRITPAMAPAAVLVSNALKLPGVGTTGIAGRSASIWVIPVSAAGGLVHPAVRATVGSGALARVFICTAIPDRSGPPAKPR